VAARQAAADAAAAEESVPPVHDDNEWSIEVVPDNGGDAGAVPHDMSAGAGRSDGLAEGIEYSMPVRDQHCIHLCTCCMACNVLLK